METIKTVRISYRDYKALTINSIRNSYDAETKTIEVDLVNHPAASFFSMASTPIDILFHNISVSPEALISEAGRTATPELIATVSANQEKARDYLKSQLGVNWEILAKYLITETDETESVETESTEETTESEKTIDTVTVPDLPNQFALDFNGQSASDVVRDIIVSCSDGSSDTISFSIDNLPSDIKSFIDDSPSATFEIDGETRFRSVVYHSYDSLSDHQKKAVGIISKIFENGIIYPMSSDGRIFIYQSELNILLRISGLYDDYITELNTYSDDKEHISNEYLYRAICELKLEKFLKRFN